ncbi:hypothetical protein F5Y01DRAFT_290601 [Xylaria sp. FL0043]|nr:hypothetical protein F5Y01DRAFT_290601 [Xylaria sp. FL0043]
MSHSRPILLFALGGTNIARILCVPRTFSLRFPSSVVIPWSLECRVHCLRTTTASYAANPRYSKLLCSSDLGVRPLMN